MRILHISNDYLGSKVFKNLFTELNTLGYNQDVLCYIRKGQIISTKSDVSSSVVHEYFIYLGHFISLIGRVVPYLRNVMLFRYFKKNNLGPYDCTHAHTLIANGSFSLMLYKKLRIPYIVTIRNSDVNFILKYFRHLNGLVKQVLIHADKIIFISPVYRERLITWFDSDLNIKNSIINKSVILPNGVDDFWIKNVNIPKDLSKTETVNLLFVGEISQNKNLDYLLNVFKILPDNRFNLWIIGGANKVKKNIKHLNSIKQVIAGINNVTYLGSIQDKERLLDYYRKAHIFFMASKFETFGLVYIEAMSQGNPIIYTEGEGIDGYFKSGEVGFATDGASLDSALFAINSIIDDYKNISIRCIENSLQFSWHSIALQYDNTLKLLSNKLL